MTNTFVKWVVQPKEGEYPLFVLWKKWAEDYPNFKKAENI